MRRSTGVLFKLNHCQIAGRLHTHRHTNASYDAIHSLSTQYITLFIGMRQPVFKFTQGQKLNTAEK